MGEEIGGIDREEREDEKERPPSQDFGHVEPAADVHEVAHHHPKGADVFTPEENPTQADEVEGEEDAPHPDELPAGASRLEEIENQLPPTEEALDGEKNSLI